MSAVVVLACAVLGMVVGALLPQPVYRLAVPRGTPPRAACAVCERPLRWCRRCVVCGTRSGPPAWVLSAVAGAGCAGVGWRFGWRPALAPYLVLVLLGVLLGALDVACQRLPDVLVLPGVAVGAVLLALAGPGSAVRALAGGLALFGGYAALALLPGGDLGYGDVKLAGLLGLHLGWLGWPELAYGALLPFALTAPLLLVLLALRRVDRRTPVPFGPAMLAGAWLVVVAGGLVGGSA